MSAWRTIEDVPAGECLLFFPTVVTGAYAQTKLGWMIRIGRFSDFPNRVPTHWMPLPTPPEMP